MQIRFFNRAPKRYKLFFREVSGKKMAKKNQNLFGFGPRFQSLNKRLP